MQLPWRDVALDRFGGLGDNVCLYGPVISTSLTEAETKALQRLAIAGDVLEIGSAFGYSAIAMALVGARVVAVDPHHTHNSYEAMLTNLGPNYGVAGRVDVRRGDSRAVLPQLFEAGLRFDLVWIDGDHSAEMVEHDVTWARKLLQETGSLACHDYDEDTCPGVRLALDKLFGGPGTLTDTLAVYGPGEW